MTMYALTLCAKWAPEVGRSRHDGDCDVDLDELYPDEMEENTDGECPLVNSAQGISPTLVVADEAGRTREIALDPFGDNPESIAYEDAGEFFDESDLSGDPWLYVCKVGDQVNWSCELETDEPFDASKLTVSYKSFVDGEGDANILILPVMAYDGEELYFDCEGGEGTEDECAWLLSADGRETLER